MGWIFRPEDTHNYTRLQIVTDQVNYTCEKYTDKVVYGRQRGSVCYLAVRTTNHETNESVVNGLVVLTSIDSKSSFNFGTKYISETMGPHYYHAPKKLIEMLSPTDSKFANEWRQQCLSNVGKNTKRKKDAEILRSLPLGSVIRIADPAGTRVSPYMFSGHRRYKVLDRWARVTTSYILNFGFEVESTPKQTRI